MRACSPQRPGCCDEQAAVACAAKVRAGPPDGRGSLVGGRVYWRAAAARSRGPCQQACLIGCCHPDRTAMLYTEQSPGHMPGWSLGRRLPFQDAGRLHHHMPLASARSSPLWRPRRRIQPPRILVRLLKVGREAPSSPRRVAIRSLHMLLLSLLLLLLLQLSQLSGLLALRFLALLSFLHGLRIRHIST